MVACDMQALTNAGILDSETAQAYGNLFSRFMRQQRKAHLDWDKLTPPGSDMVVDYEGLEQCPEHEPLQHVRFLAACCSANRPGWSASAMALNVSRQ